MSALREDIHLVRHHRIDETNEGEYLPPLCLQQSTGNSAAPEVDVVLRLLNKKAALRAARAIVSDSPAEIGITMKRALGN